MSATRKTYGNLSLFFILGIIITGCTNHNLSNIRTDAHGVQMILIPEGEFLMGATEEQANRYDENVMPIHTVFLNAYYIDKYETTNTEYQTCVDVGICSPLERDPKAIADIYYSEEVFGNSPVMYLSWADAKTYCEWRGARLPTEAEWEKAARGTDGRTYPWGEEIDCSYAAYGDYEKKRGCANGMILPVGNYPKNVSPYGVFDMAGNVSEWVEDCYVEDFYTQIDDGVSNPVVTGKNNCIHIRRGGGASYNLVNITTFIRKDLGNIDYRGYWSGARCAWSP